jgi:excisionase family DNA binding protein
MEAELLSVAALARKLRLPASWLKAEAIAGRIPCLRVGRKMLFNQAAVQQALLSRAAGEQQDGTVAHVC